MPAHAADTAETHKEHDYVTSPNQSRWLGSTDMSRSTVCSYISIRCQTVCVCTHVRFSAHWIRVCDRQSIRNICSPPAASAVLMFTEDTEGHCLLVLRRMKGTTYRSAHPCQDPLFSSTVKKVIHFYPTHNNGVGATTLLSLKVLRLLMCSKN